MAKMKISFPTAFMVKLERLQGGVLDDAYDKALNAAADIVYDAMQQNLDEAIGQDIKSPFGSMSTGELSTKIKKTGVRISSENVHSVFVGFDDEGTDRSHGATGGKINSSNYEIAMFLEYGREGQPPRPFVKPTKKQVRKVVKAKMKEILTEAIENA